MDFDKDCLNPSEKMGHKLKDILENINISLEALGNAKVDDMNEFHKTLKEIIHKALRLSGINSLEYGTWDIKIKGTHRKIMEVDVFEFIDNKTCKYKRKGKLIKITFKLIFEETGEVYIEDLEKWFERKKLSDELGNIKGLIKEANDNIAKWQDREKELLKLLERK